MLRGLPLIATMLAASACMTTPAPKSAQYTPALASHVLRADWIDFTKLDGRRVGLDDPRDFGTAYCDHTTGCIAKDNIVSITWTEQRGDPRATVGQAAAFVVVSPLVLGLCATGNCYSEIKQPPVAAATPQLVSRLWLDQRWSDGKQIFQGRNNWCLQSAAFTTQAAFTTDAAALDWVYRNRHTLWGHCLLSAARVEAERRTPEGAERARRLFALGVLRINWDQMRCSSPAQFPYGIPTWLDLGPRRGNPAVLDAITEALADPASYSVVFDEKDACGGRFTPQTDWPARQARIAAGGPFAAESPPARAGQ